MRSALMRLESLGIKPKTIVDVGAANGMWTKIALDFWPNAKFELIEPLEEQILNLGADLVNNTNVSVHMGVAGAQKSLINFSVSDDLDGSGVYGENSKNIRELPVLTIDDVCRETISPIFIKLDTHGFEVPILEGARETLIQTEALIIEVYGFYVSPTALLFHQLSSYLEEKGFRLYDVVDIMRRKTDNSFWQADAIYLKNTNSIFNNNTYN